MGWHKFDRNPVALDSVPHFRFFSIVELVSIDFQRRVVFASATSENFGVNQINVGKRAQYEGIRPAHVGTDYPSRNSTKGGKHRRRVISGRSETNVFHDFLFEFIHEGPSLPVGTVQDVDNPVSLALYRIPCDAIPNVKGNF